MWVVMDPNRILAAASTRMVETALSLHQVPLTDEEEAAGQEMHTRMVAAFNAMSEEGIPAGKRPSIVCLAMVMLRVCDEFDRLTKEGR